MLITKSLGFDDLTGLETIHHFDESTGKTWIEHKQDVQSVLDHTQRLRGTDHMKVGVKESWMHAAIIPEIVQIKWMRDYGIKDVFSEEYWPLIKNLLNGEYKYLKTGDLRI